MLSSRGLAAALGRDKNVLQRAGERALAERRVISLCALKRVASRTESSHSGAVATSKAIDDRKHRVSVAEAARLDHMHSQERLVTSADRKSAA